MPRRKAERIRPTNREVMTSDKYLLKVCGTTDGENIRAIESLGVDYIGFIFYEKSPRFVANRPSYLPDRKKRVGVFVNSPIETILKTATEYQLSAIQLHGDESPQQCRLLKEKGYRIIKAFQIAHEKDIKAMEAYEGECDYFLFDTKSSSYGGTGKHFNWDILSHYKGKTPFLLSGGIGIEMLDTLKTFEHPKCVGFDLNSKFETKPGIKDIHKLRQ